MSVFVGWQSALCNLRRQQHVSKDKVKGRGRHAYEAVTTGRSFVRATKADRRGKVQSGRYAVAISAVAADKTMRLRNVP
jgi:acyl CoA:acetate/3-ketoacid CoA transferase